MTSGASATPASSAPTGVSNGAVVSFLGPADEETALFLEVLQRAHHVGVRVGELVQELLRQQTSGAVTGEAGQHVPLESGEPSPVRLGIAADDQRRDGRCGCVARTGILRTRESAVEIRSVSPVAQ